MDSLSKEYLDILGDAGKDFREFVVLGAGDSAVITPALSKPENLKNSKT